MASRRDEKVEMEAQEWMEAIMEEVRGVRGAPLARRRETWLAGWKPRRPPSTPSRDACAGVPR